MPGEFAAGTSRAEITGWAGSMRQFACWSPIRVIVGSLTDEPSEARKSTTDLALVTTPGSTGLPGDVAERLKAAVC